MNTKATVQEITQKHSEKTFSEMYTKAIISNSETALNPNHPIGIEA
jgi:hypothetical protein